MGVKACLKKEFIEAKRGKTFLSIFGMCLAFAIVAILYVVLMQFASTIIQTDNEELQILFQNFYGSSMGYFGVFVTTYFFIILIVMYSNTISKEVNSKQWILPINAGIKPKHLIFARMISATITVAISFIASAIIHFILTILLCESGGMQITNMLLAYVSMLIALEFITITTISLNAITKKRAITIIVVLLVYVLVSAILSNFVIGKTGVTAITIADCTPFFFQNYPLTFMNGASYPTYIWLSASLSTLAITFILAVWAIASFKVKPEKAIAIKSNKKGFLGLFKKNEIEEEN